MSKQLKSQVYSDWAAFCAFTIQADNILDCADMRKSKENRTIGGKVQEYPVPPAFVATELMKSLFCLVLRSVRSWVRV